MGDTQEMANNILLALVLSILLVLAIGAYSFFKQRALQKQVLSLTKSSALSYLSYLPFNNPTPIFCSQRTGKIIFVNLAGEELLSAWNLKKGMALPQVIVEPLEEAFTYSKEVIRVLKIKEVIYRIYLIPDKGLKTAGIYIQDITALKKMEQTLVKNSLYDLVTNLPNRSLFYDYVKLELIYQKKGHKVFIMIVKMIDYVNLLNHHGIDFCNKVVQFTQLQLKRFLSDEAVLARLGEKEFGMMEPIYSDSVQGALLCKKIVSYFDNPIKISNKEIVSRVAIGIAHFPEDGNTPNALLKNAKMAQQQALLEPVRFMGYHLEEDIKVESKKGLLMDLYQALNKKQFSIVYQPQVSVSTQKRVGAEALIRWKHPELGFISPMSFIPLAESSGLIIPLGQWIIDQVFQDLKQWSQKDPQRWQECKIAINLSAIQFKTETLIEEINKSLSLFGLLSKNIEFEMTESILASDIEEIIKKMTELNQYGFSLSMDDFGTGYSSLSYLKKLPIHKLKIDKAFIDDIEYHEPSLAMVKSIVELGHSLGLKVLAEGVENEAQFAILKKLNCDIIQGYYFSKPLSAQDFEQFE